MSAPATGPHRQRTDGRGAGDAIPPSAAWRQPVMWLVLGLPALVVIAGIRMIFIAGGDGSTDASPDRVQRTAQIQTADLGPDAAARDAGLSAIVRFVADADAVDGTGARAGNDAVVDQRSGASADSGLTESGSAGVDANADRGIAAQETAGGSAALGWIEVLAVSGRFAREAPLQLQLLHPVRQSADRTLLLQPGPNGWRARAQWSAAHDWNLRLGPQDGSWRLQGRWPRAQRATTLQPSLQEH